MRIYLTGDPDGMGELAPKLRVEGHSVLASEPDAAWKYRVSLTPSKEWSLKDFRKNLQHPEGLKRLEEIKYLLGRAEVGVLAGAKEKATQLNQSGLVRLGYLAAQHTPVIAYFPEFNASAAGLVEFGFCYAIVDNEADLLRMLER